MRRRDCDRCAPAWNVIYHAHARHRIAGWGRRGPLGAARWVRRAGNASATARQDRRACEEEEERTRDGLEVAELLQDELLGDKVLREQRSARVSRSRMDEVRAKEMGCKAASTPQTRLYVRTLARACG